MTTTPLVQPQAPIVVYISGDIEINTAQSTPQIQVTRRR